MLAFYHLDRRQMPRTKYSIQELDDRLIKTFSKLFELGRYDQQKIHSLDEILNFAMQLNKNISAVYLALEKLLNLANISEEQLPSKDIWIFSVYQTVRQIEHKKYNKRHVYTTAEGKAFAQAVIQRLDSLLKNWIDDKGRILKSPFP